MSNNVLMLLNRGMLEVMERIAPAERLGLDIKRAEQALMAAKSAAVRAAELTVAQYAALLGLSESPGISGAALARSCLVTPQAMAAVLKGLEEHGLVERSRHAWHGNVLELRLSEHGERALLVADREAVKIERRIAEALAPEEQQVLRDLLARCIEAIQGAQDR